MAGWEVDLYLAIVLLRGVVIQTPRVLSDSPLAGFPRQWAPTPAE